MKKFLVYFTIVVMVFSLTACGEKENNYDEEKRDNVQAERKHTPEDLNEDIKLLLPDSNEVTEMNVYRMSNNTILFRNGKTSVVALGYDAIYSDYLALAGNHVDVLFLEELNEDTFGNLKDAYEYGSIDTIYVPKGADKAYMKHLKEFFYESEVIQLKEKGKKFVVGEMVISVVNVLDEGVAFTLTHGHDSFLVANNEFHNLSYLKNEENKVAFAPYSVARKLTNIDYYICLPEGGDPPVEEFSSICIQYVIPEIGAFYGQHTKDGVFFNTSFTPTGK